MSSSAMREEAEAVIDVVQAADASDEKGVMRESIGQSSEESLDILIEQKRQELQLLREERLEWQKTIQQLSQKLEAAQATLRTRLEKESSVVLRRCGTPSSMEAMKRIYFRTQQTLPPVYVLNQHAALHTAMHVTFWTLPKQMALIKLQQKPLLEYLEKERLDVLQLLDESNRQSVERVSRVAEANNSYYDAYQQTINNLESQVRSLTATLAKASDSKKLANATMHTHNSETDHCSVSSSSSFAGDAPHDDDDDEISLTSAMHLPGKGADEESSMSVLEDSFATASAALADFWHSSIDNLRKVPAS